MPRPTPIVVLASAAAVAMVVLALWCWQRALPIAEYYRAARPDVAARAIRSASAATIAAAQLVVVLFVIRRTYPRGLVDGVVARAAALALGGAVACAIAFAAAGR